MPPRNVFLVTCIVIRSVGTGDGGSVGSSPTCLFAGLQAKPSSLNGLGLKFVPYPTFPDLPTDLVTIVLLCVGKSQIFDNLDGLLNVHE